MNRIAKLNSGTRMPKERPPALGDVLALSTL
jgi:hypothetical protein